jgi:YidC/Oxa1 family membrane protein insertase
VSILNPLYDLIARVLMAIHAMLAVPFGAATGVSWALSIVLLVILLRVIMLPLFIKQVHAQQRMQQHMPQLQEIRKKYKNDKQKLNEETMKYYKENGVNPLSGCLPLIAQFPVFISLFSVLRAISQGHEYYGLTQPVIASAQHARVFGVLLSDTFLHSHTPWSVRGVILASVLISAVTTFLTVRQSQRRGMLQQGAVDPDNPMVQSQKYMMYITPLFALSGLYWQYGLVIYWVTNNMWTMGQQYFLFRNLPVVGSATVSGATAAAQPGGGKAQAAGTSGKAAAPGKAAAASKAPASTGKATSVANAGRVSSATRAPGKAAPASKSAEAAKASGAGQSANAGQPAKAAQPANANANGAPSAAGSSGLGGARSLLRLGKRTEPEPETLAPPKVTVRQQPARQTRSKRSGKR